MSFVNKKEEVLKIELTQFGRKLLSIGRFKPLFYQFFDDDILYDTEYAGVSEQQNESESRIKESQTVDVQHLVLPLSKMHEPTEIVSIPEEEPSTINRFGTPGFAGNIVPIKLSTSEIENNKTLGYPLCHMDLGTQDAPRFSINFIDTKISGSTYSNYNNAGEPGKFRQIPQLKFEPTYTLERDTRATTTPRDELNDGESFLFDPTLEGLTFRDGSTLRVREENVSLVMEEFNVPDNMENFVVEVFEIETLPDNSERITKLEKSVVQQLFEMKLDSDVPDSSNYLSNRNLGSSYRSN